MGIAVLVVEGREIARRGLADMLDDLSNVELLAAVATVGEARRRIKEAQRRPDVVVVGSDLPRSELPTLGCSFSLLVLLRAAEPAHLAAAGHVGADGCLVEAEVSTTSLGAALGAMVAGVMPVAASLDLLSTPPPRRAASVAHRSPGPSAGATGRGPQQQADRPPPGDLH